MDDWRVRVVVQIGEAPCSAHCNVQPGLPVQRGLRPCEKEGLLSPLVRGHPGIEQHKRGFANGALKCNVLTTRLPDTSPLVLQQILRICVETLIRA